MSMPNEPKVKKDTLDKALTVRKFLAFGLQCVEFSGFGSERFEFPQLKSEQVEARLPVRVCR